MAERQPTEKATPKKREEARKKGQVAKLDRPQRRRRAARRAARAVRLRARRCASAIGDATRRILARSSPRPTSVEREGVGAVLAEVGDGVAAARSRRSPLVCLVAGVADQRRCQVGFKPSAAGAQAGPQEAQPDHGRQADLRPARALRDGQVHHQGRRRRRDRRASPCCRKLEELAALVGMPPAVLRPELAHTVLAHRPARRRRLPRDRARRLRSTSAGRHEKSLKMDKQEVKDEHKQQELPAEVKGMQRRRAMEMARARMMDAVPTADVVVTNPTHYSVALRYSADALAPVVVAKGQDLVALRIRELAARARRHGRARPAARPRPARLRRGRPDDPRGAVPGRRRAARLRLPRQREGRRRMNTPDEEGRPARRPDRRGRGRAGRRDDDRPAAAVPARPRDHAEHLGRADDRRRDALRAARARLLRVPEPPAADHAVPARDQRLGHAPDPAARRRRPRGRRVRQLRRRRQRGRRPDHLPDPRRHPVRRHHERRRPRGRGRRALHARRHAGQADGDRRRPQHGPDHRRGGAQAPRRDRPGGRLLRRDGRRLEVRQGRRDGRHPDHADQPRRRHRHRRRAAGPAVRRGRAQVLAADRRRRPVRADPGAADLGRHRHPRHALGVREGPRQRHRRPDPRPAQGADGGRRGDLRLRARSRRCRSCRSC